MRHSRLTSMVCGSDPRQTVQAARAGDSMMEEGKRFSTASTAVWMDGRTASGGCRSIHTGSV